MSSLRELLAMWTDPRMKETIRNLWREIHDDNVSENIIQEANGFVYGEAVKVDPVSGLWVRSQADTMANAGTIGLVCRIVDANTFWVRRAGLLYAPSGTYIVGFAYYLSTATAGALFVQSNPEVWDAGNVREFIGTGVEGGLMIEIDRAIDVVTDKHYRHTQLSPSRVWEAHHNLGKNPSVTITDFDGNEYEAQVAQIDDNSTLLTFSESFAGYADFN